MSGTRKLLLVLALGLLMIFVQGTVFKTISMGLVIPNLIVVFVVFLSFYDVSAFGCFLVFVLGLELDLSAGVLLGPWAGACVAVFAVLASLSQRIFVDSSLAVALAALASSAISQIVYGVLTYETRPVTSDLLIRGVIEAILTGLVAPLVFKLLKLIFVGTERSASGRYRTSGA